MGLTRPRLGQFQTTTTAFDDEIIVLNNSATGTNTNDIGIVFERGDSTNTALIWDESADTFSLISTTEQGSTQGNVSISSYSALKVGNLTTNGITLPTSDGTNGQVIVTDGSGNLSFTTISEASNTTYDLLIPTGTTTLRLDPSTGTNDDIVLVAGSNVTLTRDSATQLTIASTDTNTTYSVGDGGLTENNFTSVLKSKLDGIATSANNYTHPTGTGNEHLPSTVSQTEAGYLNGVTSAIQTQLNSKTTESYVNTQVTNLIGGAPGALDTLNELAAAINDDASYASSITSSLGSKVGTSSAQSLSSAANAMTISGSVITLARGDGTTDAVTLPASGNTVIGTDSDINTSGATIIDSLTMTDGVITAHGTRTLTASDISALPLSGGTLTGGEYPLTLVKSTNAGGIGIKFDDHTGGNQYGYFKGHHSDSESGTPSAGYSFHFSSSEATTNVVLNGGGTFIGTATSAQYADLAENYVSDANYAVGTVLVFGGVNEVTISTTKEDKRIAGVVSSNPAYLMNSECVGEHIAPIALQGRVPCRVTGVVEKGDLIVSSSVTGVGVSWNENHDPRAGSVIGKSLVNKNTQGEENIEVVVGVR
jgi:hypothetical protein